MRLRFVPEAAGIIEKSPYVIHDALPLARDIITYYKKEQPLHIEIGTGKGGFIVEMARRDPDVNFLGVERYESVLYRACEKLDAFPEEERPSNVLFFSHDARELVQALGERRVPVIYLNFSDPWPKKKHAKRRLTSRNFLNLYEKILEDGGQVIFKTDNRALFDFSVEEIGGAENWEITDLTYDLHRDPVRSEGNIMTEYERKFSALGTRINKLIAVWHKPKG